MNSPIPVNDLKRHNQAVAAAMAQAYARVFERGRWVAGPELQSFESAFSDYCGARQCIGVANGTDALELALRGVGIEAGDQVATVANAGMYASSAIRAIGAHPLYVDVDERTLLMDISQLRRAIGPRVRAIVATHLYGRMVDLEALVALARAGRIPVIEDCAQAHGARRNGHVAGTIGDVGCFSFYPTKNLGALGDAGALITDDEQLAQRLRRLRQYGWSSKYVAETPGGRNSRLDELQAAMLCAKLPHLDGWNRRRRAIAARFNQAIRHPDIRLPPDGGDDHVAHLYVVRTSRRQSLREHLLAHGVATEVHYPVPDHRQPAVGVECSSSGLPITEASAEQVLSLPCFPELTEDELARVVAACNGWKG